jgi:hypothetical protein
MPMTKIKMAATVSIKVCPAWVSEKNLKWRGIFFINNFLMLLSY